MTSRLYVPSIWGNRDARPAPSREGHQDRLAYPLGRMQRLLVSWFGTGLVLHRLRGDHNGSGSLASAVTLPLALLVGSLWGPWGLVAVAAVVTVAGIWALQAFYVAEGDAGWMVIDEAAAVFVSVIGLVELPAILVAWAVFRLADILKRVFPGVQAAEDVGGPVGVMGDDFVAALYGLAAGHLTQYLF